MTPDLAVALFHAFAILRRRWPKTFAFTEETSEHAMAKTEEWAKALTGRNVSLTAIAPAAQRWVDTKDKPPYEASRFATFALEVDVAEFRHAGRLDHPAPPPKPLPAVITPAMQDPHAAVRARLTERFGDARARDARGVHANRLFRRFFFHVYRLGTTADRGADAVTISDALYEASARCAEYDGIVADVLCDWTRIDEFWPWWEAHVGGALQERIPARLVSEAELRAALRTFADAHGVLEPLDVAV